MYDERDLTNMVGGTPPPPQPSQAEFQAAWDAAPEWIRTMSDGLIVFGYSLLLSWRTMPEARLRELAAQFDRLKGKSNG